MRFNIEERPGAVVIKLKGDVMGGPDGSRLHDTLRELVDAGQKHVVADLSRVRFMNSSGLGLLIGGLATMRNAGGDLRLANATDRIQSLLMIAKLLSVFRHYESVDEAVESFTTNPPEPAQAEGGV